MNSIMVERKEHRFWPQVSLDWHMGSALNCATLGKLFNLSKSKP